MDNRTGYRHELKYEICPFEQIELRRRLRAVMKPDEHAGGDGTYRVNSLYFDNYNDKALREKLAGVGKREKFRIRYYNNDFSQISLEKKLKYNGLCKKLSAPLTWDQCEKLLGGDCDWMAGSDSMLILDLYIQMKHQLLRPKTAVSYLREAYVFPAGNVRVTFDSDIRSGLYGACFPDAESTTFPIADASKIILEVKYDGFLPELIGCMLQTGTRRAQAFSKYAGCRIFEENTL